MSVLPPRTPLEAEPPRTAAPLPPPSPPSPARRTTPERIVLGVLLAAAGAAWLLDEIGVSVPWALAPAAAVVVIGVALVLTARDRTGHAPLVVWGAILLAVSLAVTAVRPVGGTLGDRVLSPTASQWPVATSVAAGNLTVDLRQTPLPASGRLTAHVNAGNVLVRLLGGAGARPVTVVAHVGAGQIRVDGVVVRNGLGLDWTSPGPTAPVIVDLQVGAGNLEVDHD